MKDVLMSLFVVVVVLAVLSMFGVEWYAPLSAAVAFVAEFLRGLIDLVTGTVS